MLNKFASFSTPSLLQMHPDVNRDIMSRLGGRRGSEITVSRGDGEIDRERERDLDGGRKRRGLESVGGGAWRAASIASASW